MLFDQLVNLSLLHPTFFHFPHFHTQSVAAEMIEELGLTLSMSDLAQQMEVLIQQAGDVGTEAAQDGRPADFQAPAATAGVPAESRPEAPAAAAPSAEAQPSSLAPQAEQPTDNAEPSSAAGPPPIASLPPDLESMLEAEYGKLVNESDVHAEMDKVDKESRVSRRAFEQRIEKHKVIQVETCSMHTPQSIPRSLCFPSPCSFLHAAFFVY